MNHSDLKYGLSTYSRNGSIHVGLVVEDKIWEINGILKRYDSHHEDMRSMKMVLENWDRLLPIIRQAAAVTIEEQRAPDHHISDVTVLSPVPSPGKMINVGLNFYDHAQEMGMTIPEGFQPSFFWKGDGNCIIGADEKIVPSSEFVDWEAELAVVIAHRAKDVPVDQAMDYVAGFTCHNDITDRSLMMMADGRLDFYSGKCRDTFGPLGPVLVPTECVPDIEKLRIRSLLNGEVMQDSGTDQMVWGPAQCVSYLSSCTTLMPGDVIALGTGAGTGWTKGITVGPGELSRLIDHMKSGGGLFLEKGDRITVDIPGVGRLENEVA